jgi:hypothetical protein
MPDQDCKMPDQASNSQKNHWSYLSIFSLCDCVIIRIPEHGAAVVSAAWEVLDERNETYKIKGGNTE